MAIPFAAAGAAATGAFSSVKAIVQIGVESRGARTLMGLVRVLGLFRSKLFRLGVTTIFLDRLVQSLTRAWTGLNQAIGATRVSEYARDVSRFAEQARIGVAEFQALTILGKDFHAEMSDVADLFQTFNERVDDLKSGLEPGIVEDFARYGVFPSDFPQGTNPLDQILIFADKMAALSREKSFAAMEKLLGGGLNQKFGATLQQGSAAIIRQMRTAAATGAVMSAQQIEQAKRFRAEQTRFAQVMFGLGNHVAQIFMPALRWIAGALTVIFKQISLFVRSNLDRWAQRLLAIVISITQRMMGLTNLIDQQIMPLGDFVSRLVQGLGGVAAIATVLFGAPVITGVGLLVAGITILAIIVEDLFSFMRGEKSAFATLYQSSPLIRTIVDTLWAVWSLLVMLKEQVVGLFADLATSTLFYDLLILFIGGIGVLIGLLGATVAILRIAWRVLEAVWGLLKGILMTIVGIVEAIGSAAAGILGFKSASKWLQTLASKNITVGVADAIGAIPGMFRGTGSPTMGFDAMLGRDLSGGIFTPPGGASNVRGDTTFNLTIQSADPDATAGRMLRHAGVLADELED